MNKYIYDIKDLTLTDYTHYFNNMSTLRRDKVSRLKFDENKKQTVAGEMLVKKHYGEDSVIDISNLKKPYLTNKKGEFSISHSKNYVLVAVNDTYVGADIEVIRDVNLNIIKKVCNKKEEEYVLNGIDSKEKNIRLLEIWTFKEAYFKYLGTGIKNLKSADYFDENIKREKYICDEYIYHIVY